MNKLTRVTFLACTFTKLKASARVMILSKISLASLLTGMGVGALSLVMGLVM